MMTVCPNCGKPGIGQEQFCRACGAPLQMVNPQMPGPQYQPYPAQNGPAPNGPQFGWQQHLQQGGPALNGPAPNGPQFGWQQFPQQGGPVPNGPAPSGLQFGWQQVPQQASQQVPPQIPQQDGQTEPPRQNEQPEKPSSDEQQTPQQGEQPQMPSQDGQQPPRRTRRRQPVPQDGQSQDVQPPQDRPQPQPQPTPPQPVPQLQQPVSQPQPQQTPQPQPMPPQSFAPQMGGQVYARQMPGNTNIPDASFTSGKKQKNRKKILIICGIVLAIALIILLIFLLLGKGKEDNTSNPTAQSGQSAGFQRKKTDFTEFKTVGNIGTFGYYEQDNNPDNGPEPIEWIVIEAWADRALLLSRYALDAKPYNTESADTTWAQCSLREWLNNDFLNAAFDRTEQAALITMRQDNYRIWPETDGGNDTDDPVFLLSRWDVYSTGTDESYRDRYVFAGDEGRMCTATDYAIANGAWVSTEYQADGRPTVCWWLRSTGYHQNSAMFVDEDGSARFFDVSMDRYAVRPAVWVNLETATPTPEATDTPANRRKWD